MHTLFITIELPYYNVCTNIFLASLCRVGGYNLYVVDNHMILLHFVVYNHCIPL